jgi:hypothetical protein
MHIHGVGSHATQPFLEALVAANLPKEKKQRALRTLKWSLKIN